MQMVDDHWVRAHTQIKPKALDGYPSAPRSLAILPKRVCACSMTFNILSYIERLIAQVDFFVPPNNIIFGFRFVFVSVSTFCGREHTTPRKDEEEEKGKESLETKTFFLQLLYCAPFVRPAAAAATTTRRRTRIYKLLE